jgi:hypothetical protein
MTLPIVPFFIIDMLIGLFSEARTSGGRMLARNAAKSGDIISDGLMVLLSIPLSALKVTPVALTLGKYLVNASSF